MNRIIASNGEPAALQVEPPNVKLGVGPWLKGACITIHVNEGPLRPRRMHRIKLTPEACRQLAQRLIGIVETAEEPEKAE